MNGYAPKTRAQKAVADAFIDVGGFVAVAALVAALIWGI